MVQLRLRWAHVAQENTQKIISVTEALWAADDIHDRLWSSGVMYKIQTSQ
jgi:hypothetical protein